MKHKVYTAVLVLVFLAGLSLLLYPAVSDWWNSLHASKAVADYSAEVEELSSDRYDLILEEAREYNRELAAKSSGYYLSNEQSERYQSVLDVTGTGIMGYIEIPVIEQSLPIYHGTDESVLQIAVGHIEWSSLPVGGESSHCVLSGHRGLPSAKLFTNLDRLVVGDTFVLRVLDEVLTYEVDRILIVEPDDLSELGIVEGMDYCTLVTCTPYGVNSHRLLVRGHRIENEEKAEEVRVTSDAVRIEPVIVAPIVAAPILLALIIIVLCSGKRKKPSGGRRDEDGV